MQNDFSKRIQNKLSIFGYYQILGGIIGLGLLIWLLLNLTSFYSLLLIIIVPAFILFSFSIYCGILLLKKPKVGIKLSLINQCLQLFSFSLGGYTYLYFSGLYFTVGLDLTESMNFLFNFGVSSWTLNINTNSPAIELKFNLVAFYLVIAIQKLRKQIEFEENNRLIQSIADTKDA